MAVPDEEVGGELGATWMREKHYSGARPGSTSSTRAASVAVISSRAGSGLRHFGGREEDDVAEAGRRGVAGHGSQPHDKNPERPALSARSRDTARRADADSAVQRPRHAQVARSVHWRQQVQQRHRALDDLDHDAAAPESATHRKSTSSRQWQRRALTVGYCRVRRRSSGSPEISTPSRRSGITIDDRSTKPPTRS